MYIMYILLSLVAFMLSILLFRYASGTLSILKLNLITVIFYFQLFLQSFLGVNIAILRLDNHYLLSKIQDQDIRLVTYLSVLYVMIILPLSMVLTSKVLKFNAKEELHQYLSKPIEPIVSKDDSAMFIAMVLFSGVSIISIIYTFASIGTWPLLEVIKGKDPFYLAHLRIEVSQNFAGNDYVKNILGLTLSTVLSYIAYAYYKLYAKKHWKYLFIILFLSAVIMQTHNLAKSPVLWYLLGFLFLKIYIEGKLSKKLLMIAGIGITLLVVVFYVALGSATHLSTFLSINTGPLGRILIGQIMGLFFHFQLFPKYIPFLEGQSFPQMILSFFHMESVRSGRLVMSVINQTGVQSGTAGVMNTLFIGEAYANFGWAGVFLGTIYVGLVIQLIYILFLRLPKNPIWLGLFAYLTIQLSNTITGGFVDFIYSAVYIAIFVLMIILHYIGKNIGKTIEQVKLE